MGEYTVWWTDNDKSTGIERVRAENFATACLKAGQILADKKNVVVHQVMAELINGNAMTVFHSDWD